MTALRELQPYLIRGKYADFQQVTCSRTLSHLMQHSMIPVAQELLLTTEAGLRKVRLLGLTVSHLTNKDAPTVQLLIPFDSSK